MLVWVLICGMKVINMLALDKYYVGYANIGWLGA